VSWQISWTRRAIKDLRRLSPHARERTTAALERLARTGAGDVIRLTDVAPPEWRLRVGDVRVRFELDDGASTLTVLRVLPRDKVYR
jgi:mRNA interferase RelE/StbE